MHCSGRQRREYSVVGDVVNMSARLMQAAANGVLVDRATTFASMSERRLSFTSLGEIKVKGKDNLIAIFKPKYMGGAVSIHRPPTDATVGVGRRRELRKLTALCATQPLNSGYVDLAIMDACVRACMRAGGRWM